MELAAFKRAHIDCFLRSAKAEGWISEQREMEFLLRNNPAGCLVCLAEGKAIAFITAICYARTAWIGNLLVLPDYRQRGIARALLEKINLQLDVAGCETTWLTASSDGAHLYRMLGFKDIDRVQRWKTSGVTLLGGDKPAFSAAEACIDSTGWGDNRAAIFAELPVESGCFTNNDGFLVHSAMAGGRQIGPWGATSREAAAQLLATAVVGGGQEDNVFLDVPANNHFAGELLASRGFSVAGSTLLMYRGRVPAYQAEYIYSLASMGSYG